MKGTIKKKKPKNKTVKRHRKITKLKKNSKTYLFYDGLNGKEKSWYLYVMKK
jgi:hypothetical protein